MSAGERAQNVVVSSSMVVPKSSASASQLAHIDPSNFAYDLLSPRSTSEASREKLMDAYRCWRGVWAQTLMEVDGAPDVFGDDFTRQDELGALFYQGSCIGLTGYRWVDLSMPQCQDDSYFRAWPKSALGSVVEGGKRVCIGSNLTVLPNWRGAAQGISVKEVLMLLAVRRFLASDADTMVGTMRNDRGMNGLVYRLGAVPVLQNVALHGVRNDLVTFSRRAMGPIEPHPAVAALAAHVWTP
jgi:hypothetical protein